MGWGGGRCVVKEESVKELGGGCGNRGQWGDVLREKRSTIREAFLLSFLELSNVI